MSPGRVFKRAVVWLATGFGAGYSPFAPGTVGTLWGVLIAWAVNATLPVWWQQAVVSAVLVMLAIPVCSAGEASAGSKDPHCVVADEYATFPLCVIGLPVSPVVFGVAFVVHRVLDIVKPPPARQIQILPRGWGIVLDDVISSLYALAINHAVCHFVLQRML